MITITKDQAIEEGAEAFRDVHDMDVPYETYVRAVIECLEKHGLTFARERDARCSSCGRPAPTGAAADPCAFGGCPQGGDF
jgi:hypothetical protein